MVVICGRTNMCQPNHGCNIPSFKLEHVDFPATHVDFTFGFEESRNGFHVLLLTARSEQTDEIKHEKLNKLNCIN
jgi:hypothetical protein